MYSFIPQFGFILYSFSYVGRNSTIDIFQWNTFTFSFIYSLANSLFNNNRRIQQGINSKKSFVPAFSLSPSALAAPKNVVINGNTISWNAVAGATEYEVYIDGEKQTTKNASLSYDFSKSPLSAVYVVAKNGNTLSTKSEAVSKNYVKSLKVKSKVTVKKGKKVTVKPVIKVKGKTSKVLTVKSKNNKIAKVAEGKLGGSLIISKGRKFSFFLNCFLFIF